MITLFSLLAFAFAGAPEDAYKQLCSGCHGERGEGGRGPMLLGSAMPRSKDVNGLLQIIRQGIPGTDMPPIPANRLDNDTLKQLAEKVWTWRVTGEASSAAGAGRGRALFVGKGKCMECHRVRGEGGTLGPELSAIGTRSRDYLKTALLQPEKEISDSFANYRWTIDIPDNFLQVRLTTTRGEQIVAARVNEDSFTIQVHDKTGRLRSFEKSQLAKIEKNWGRTPMPSYANAFTAGELEDVLAYLSSLRGGR